MVAIVVIVVVVVVAIVVVVVVAVVPLSYDVLCSGQDELLPGQVVYVWRGVHAEVIATRLPAGQFLIVGCYHTHIVS